MDPDAEVAAAPPAYKNEPCKAETLDRMPDAYKRGGRKERRGGKGAERDRPSIKA